MHQYMISYFGGEQSESPSAQQQFKDAFDTWLESMGHAVIKPMVPLYHTHTLHPDGNITAGSDVAMMGYTIIRAVDIEQAVEHAKACPFAMINGWVEVAEVVEGH